MSVHRFAWAALISLGLAAVASAAESDRLHPKVREAFAEVFSSSYLELLEQSQDWEFSPTQIETMRRSLDNAQETCEDSFKDEAERIEDRVEKAQRQLRRLRLDGVEEGAHDLRCAVQNGRIEASQNRAFAEHSVPLAYEHQAAKLDLIEDWPRALREIQRDLKTGDYRLREYGDVEDIGLRELVDGQEKDVERGEQAAREIRRMGLMPRELEADEVTAYVRALADRVGRRSDLRVPLRVTLLDSPEINAFALPGGFLYIHRGLLEAVGDESQLVGVIAHEIAHVTARHGHRLLNRATVASILYQAAQVGVIIFTGGAVGIAGYYAVQYGFAGLGLVLNLKLLGVSRDYELEADQLGIQYAWNAGYDPSGFIRFFDKMAREEGYIRGSSWFRTHPPFYKRMLQTRREILFLPKRDASIYQTDAFLKFKSALAACAVESEGPADRDPCAPTLLEPYEKDCPPPDKIDYRPGDPIEAVCARAVARANRQ